MVNRLIEIVKLVAPLMGALVVAILPPFLKQFFPERININKWWIWGSGGLIGAIFVYWTYTGNINYRWGLTGFLCAISMYWIYKRHLAFPFKKFHVTCLESDNDDIIEGIKDGKSLITRKSAGRNDHKIWKFKGWGTWGPYLPHPLSYGRYKAVFKLMVINLDIHLDDRPVLEIDVASHCREDGDKKLALRTLWTNDFKKDSFDMFPLQFFVVNEEQRVEFRVRPQESDYIIMLDYIKLTRVGF